MEGSCVKHSTKHIGGSKEILLWPVYILCNVYDYEDLM